MKYFKNVELARLYKVSERTIGNWIEAAVEKKIDLHLEKIKNRDYILNTSHNHLIMKSLSEKGKKFRNKKAFKIIAPKEEFYKIFNQNQIIDMINDLNIHKEISHEYSYFNGGATYWDKYANKLLKEKTRNALHNTIELLDTNHDYFYSLAKGYDYINIIDIGAGNALPVKDFIERLLLDKKLGKYIAIDYSPDMLKVAENNLRTWFGNDFPYEEYVKDMNFDRFQDILFFNRMKGDKNCLNLVFLLGGSLVNQRNMDLAFHTINSSFGANDLFVYTKKLDSTRAKIYFDFSSAENTSTPKLFELGRTVVELMNIDEEDYDVEQYYDESAHSRVIKIVLTIDLEIKLQVQGKDHSVFLNSGDKITLWRAKHQNYTDVVNQFQQTGFDILHTSRSLDQEQLLVVAKIKTI